VEGEGKRSTRKRYAITQKGTAYAYEKYGPCGPVFVIRFSFLGKCLHFPKRLKASSSQAYDEPLWPFGCLSEASSMNQIARYPFVIYFLHYILLTILQNICFIHPVRRWRAHIHHRVYPLGLGRPSHDGASLVDGSNGLLII